MNKDQIEGRIADNKTLEQKGRIGKTLGSVRARYGDCKEERKKGN